MEEKPVLLPGGFVGTNSSLLSSSVGCSVLESGSIGHLWMHIQRKDTWESITQCPSTFLSQSDSSSYTLTNMPALGQASTTFFLQDLFLFLIMCMPVWVFAHEYRCPGGQKMVLDALKLELQAVMSHLMWVWKLNLNPLQGQYTLLNTKSSLQISQPLFNKKDVFNSSRTVFLFPSLSSL